MFEHKYLIVGGGMAADAAVKGIRQVDTSGAIGIISAEPDPPYKRPPLSKDLWTKHKPIGDIWCNTEAKGAEILLDRRALSLDPSKQQVIDDQGDVYRYERLLLATGGAPKRLPFGDGHVLYYRTCEDYRRLRSMTEQGRRFAVVGGGFIGSEIAPALAKNGNEVTMIFPEAGIAGLMLPAHLARALSQYYLARGVKLLPGLKLSGLEARQGFFTVRVEHGEAFPVDGIVAGIGLAPNAQLAEKAGLDVGDGMVVDEQLRTKHPHVFAAGDAANFFSPALGRRLRVEHEDSALTMGETAGRNMAGEQQPYRHLSYFYSDLFDVGYEAVGETAASLETITELRHPEEKGVIFYLNEARVRGGVFWNTFGMVDAGRELVLAPGPHTATGLKAWAAERLGR